MPDVRQLLHTGGVPAPAAQIFYAEVSSNQPLPTSVTDPVYIVVPDWSNDFYYTILGWPPLYGATMPLAGDSCMVIRDNRANIRIVWWNGSYAAPSPGGAAGGDLTGTYPNPTVANLHLAGDTSIGHKLTSVTDPGDPQDAATKHYVDAALTPSAWFTPSFVNSWSGCKYMKDASGIVRFRGSLNGGASATTAFTLPVGYRPGLTDYYIALGTGGAAGNFVGISTAGVVTPTLAGGSGVYTAPVTFLAEN